MGANNRYNRSEEKSDVIKTIEKLLEDQNPDLEALRGGSASLLVEHKALVREYRMLHRICTWQQEKLGVSEEKLRAYDELFTVLKDKSSKVQKINLKLMDANAELSEKQRLLVRLLGEVSRMQLAGDRHALRNMAQLSMERERFRVIEAISNQVALLHNAYFSDKEARNYLIASCAPFGISEIMLKDSDAVREQLLELVLDIPEGYDEKKTEMLPLNPGDDFLASLFPDEICFSRAYDEYEKVRGSFRSRNLPDLLLKADIFGLFFSVLEIHKWIREMNRRFSAMDNIKIQEPVLLSEALRLAAQQAVHEKDLEVFIQEDIQHDPLFNTSRNAFIFMLRDLFYNAMEAGATRIHILSLDPGKERMLISHSLPHGPTPVLYLCFEDNGEGMSRSHIGRINGFLSGKTKYSDTLSGKKQGGLGTRNLKTFLPLHDASCIYESEGCGTKVHLYFARTAI
ncbi:ATP-binding protein [Desulfobotulus mexicanus]|uniref:ATP-binding protein n=1 Tax=Desulfobotulus mexicanus TaxID=2586642 RepID=A0A5Q4VH31_9BACT|nr:ATP-binding protein [Desulfobotulus mexicanus]TYT75480.1 ATP-binding protein [Desulfobotulus mexicanus]